MGEPLGRSQGIRLPSRAPIFGGFGKHRGVPRRAWNFTCQPGSGSVFLAPSGTTSKIVCLAFPCLRAGTLWPKPTSVQSRPNRCPVDRLWDEASSESAVEREVNQ